MIPAFAPMRACRLGSFIAVALLICAGLLVYGSGRGFDLTDEAFYLIWIDDPRAYALTYQPFGYLLHPLFALARHDVQAFRLIGLSITLVAGALLGGAFAPRSDQNSVFRLYGALAALTIFFPWIITPSYNSAANVGAMLIIVGLLGAERAGGKRRLLSVPVAGAGLCLAAFSKPPLCAFATLAILIAAVRAKSRSATILLFASLLLGASFTTLFLAPADMSALARQIVHSQAVLALPNTVSGLPIKVLKDWLIVPVILMGGAMMVALGLVLRRPRMGKWLGYTAVVLALLYLVQAGRQALDGSIADFIGLALMILASGYAGVVRAETGLSAGVVVLLFAAPVAVALGTFNNQWFQLNFSMAFPLLALFVVARSDPTVWRGRAAYAISIAFPPCALIVASFHPYSLPDSIYRQRVPVALPLASGSVLVDPETAAFLGATEGLARGRLLIDLSGTGPGVGLALGARAPVLPWLNPATATWPDVVWSRLSPDERRRAWFIDPVWPSFSGSAPAGWLADHRHRYCSKALPSMTFWGEARTLRLRYPCSLKNESRGRLGNPAARLGGA